MPSINPVRDSKAFSDLFSDTPTPHFLFLLVGEFLKFYAFSQYCIVRMYADSFPFVFLRAVMNAQFCIVSPNPTEWSQLLQALTGPLQRLILAAIRSMHMEPAMR